jgi:hypothetical protein
MAALSNSTDSNSFFVVPNAKTAEPFAKEESWLVLLVEAVSDASGAVLKVLAPAQFKGLTVSAKLYIKCDGPVRVVSVAETVAEQMARRASSPVPSFYSIKTQKVIFTIMQTRSL